MAISSILLRAATVAAGCHKEESRHSPGRSERQRTGQAENWGRPSGGADFPLDRPGDGLVCDICWPRGVAASEEAGLTQPGFNLATHSSQFFEYTLRIGWKWFGPAAMEFGHARFDGSVRSGKAITIDTRSDRRIRLSCTIMIQRSRSDHLLKMRF